MDEYLSKPLTPDEFAAILAKWLHPTVELPAPGPPPLIYSPPASDVLIESTHPLPAINLSTLPSMGGDGGKRLCREDGGEIRGRCNGLCHPIEESIDNHETIRLSETAHGLKGISRNIGADILAQVPYELEQASAGKLNREIPAERHQSGESFGYHRSSMEPIESPTPSRATKTGI